MDPTNLQTPEEMLERWSGVECQCDPDVGHLCECCHDTQVLRDLIKERDRLRDGIDFWSYCMSKGMRDTCPERVEELADFLMSCKVEPYYIRNKHCETVVAARWRTYLTLSAQDGNEHRKGQTKDEYS